jgi:hypothetical protein
MNVVWMKLSEASLDAEMIFSGAIHDWAMHFKLKPDSIVYADHADHISPLNLNEITLLRFNMKRETTIN